MTPVSTVTGIAIPYDHSNVDTDQLMPARYLMKPRASDFGELLFRDLRFGPGATPDFLLDQPIYKGACIMITGVNFGCGSAREQAAYGLKDFGIHALAGPSFGDIFRTNCIKNGIIVAQIEPDVTLRLASDLRASPGSELTVDLLQRKVVQKDGASFSFAISEDDREALLSGKDDVARTLEHESAILEFERNYFIHNRWNPVSIVGSTRRGL